jgi:tetratricopeptide (TPR) repeat protein
VPLRLSWFIVQRNEPLASIRANPGGFVITLSFSRRLILTFLLVVSLLSSSCTRDPNVRKERYFQSGQRYFEKGKYREALIEFSNAVKIDPNYAEAHSQLAETYLRLQQGQGAYQELTRTIELQPENYQARIKLANLLILGHDFQQAQEQTNLLLQKRPNDPAIHSTVSGLLIAQGNLSGAIEETQKAVALDPGRWELHLELAMLQMKNNQPDAAETNFKKVIELNPKAMQAQLLLGNYYQSRSRFSEAEQQFHNAMGMDPKSPDPRAALARLYLAEGKKADAEGILKQAKRDFPDNSAGYRLLGDFYFLTGDVNKALAEYGALYLEHPKDIELKKNYIQLLIQTKRFAEAHKLDDEILKTNANDDDALVYQSQMQISDGDVNGAAQKLQTVIKNAPKNSEAHYVLGVAYEKLGNLESAEGEWREALRLRPDLLDAQRALAGAAMRQGDMSTLEVAATQMINLQPASPDGYALRALSYINRKRYSEAENDIRKAIDIAPQSAFGYVQLGNLKFNQRQYSDASKAYEEALDRNANSTDALRGLMNTYAAEKQLDKAIAVANAQIAKSPSNSSFYDLLGSALFYGKKDLSGADGAFEKSADLEKHNSDAWLKLCQVRAAKGQIDQAIATAQRALQDNPREPNLYVLMGKLYESKSDWKTAEDAYQKALTINPQDPSASNNLAKVMLQTGGNLDVALSLAQTARRGLPDSPSVADTLAWIDYQKGAYQSAIGLLQEALKLQEKNKMPDNLDIHYHLGMAYEKTEQPALARQHLEHVLKINPNYRDAAEIKKQLTSLKS